MKHLHLFLCAVATVLAATVFMWALFDGTLVGFFCFRLGLFCDPTRFRVKSRFSIDSTVLCDATTDNFGLYWGPTSQRCGCPGDPPCPDKHP